MPATPHGTTERLRPFGESVFSRISRLAVENGAVNLGQGFPSIRDSASTRAPSGFRR